MMLQAWRMTGPLPSPKNRPQALAWSSPRLGGTKRPRRFRTSPPANLNLVLTMKTPHLRVRPRIPVRTRARVAVVTRTMEMGRTGQTVLFPQDY